MQTLVQCCVIAFISCTVLSQRICQKKYRKIASHSACLAPSSNLVNGSTVVTEAEKKLIVAEHNGYRSTTTPRAADMQLMVWDDELAAIAQSWASNCVNRHDLPKHRKIPDRFEVGQNLAKNFRHWNETVFDFFAAKSSPLDVDKYIQLVTAKTSKVGCGKAVCKNGTMAQNNYVGQQTLFVCNYAFGIQDRVHPYTNGSQNCLACPQRCSKGLCDCSGKACYNGGSLNLTTCTCNCQQGYTTSSDCQVYRRDRQTQLPNQSPQLEDCRQGDLLLGSTCFTTIYAPDVGMSAQAAQQMCELQDASLPVFTNTSVAAAVVGKFSMNDSLTGAMWIGLRRIPDAHPIFRYTGGNGPQFTGNITLAPINKFNTTKDNQCVVMNTTYPHECSTQACTQKMPFVCKYKPLMVGKEGDTKCGFHTKTDEETDVLHTASSSICDLGKKPASSVEDLKRAIVSDIYTPGDLAVCMNMVLSTAESVAPLMSANSSVSEALGILNLFDMLLENRFESQFSDLSNATDLPFKFIRIFESFSRLVAHSMLYPHLMDTNVELNNAIIHMYQTRLSSQSSIARLSVPTSIDSVSMHSRGNSSGYVILEILYKKLTSRLPKMLQGNVTSDMASDKLLSVTALQDNWKTQVGVTYTLEKNSFLRDSQKIYKYDCRYIEFSGNVKEGGFWNNFGCEVQEANNTHISCFCNHTTNFAILVQPAPFVIEKKHSDVLKVITYVGCTLSIFCLIVAFVIFLTLAKLTSDRVLIHKYLSFSLLVFQCLFLLGPVGDNSACLCKAMAIATQYFGLVSFMWMLMEGIHLLRSIVLVYGVENSSMKVYHPCAWCIPTVLLAAGLGADYEAYGSTKDLCWIKTDSKVIWTFIAPVLAISAFNMVIVVLVIRTVVMAHNKIHSLSAFYQVQTGIKSFVMLTPLLGLTWVLGALAFNKDMMVFQYLFAICNSLQGVFLFLFCICFNSEVRSALFRKHSRQFPNRQRRGKKPPKERHRSSDKSSSKRASVWPVSFFSRPSSSNSSSSPSSGYASDQNRRAIKLELTDVPGMPSRGSRYASSRTPPKRGSQQ